MWPENSGPFCHVGGKDRLNRPRLDVAGAIAPRRESSRRGKISTARRKKLPWVIPRAFRPKPAQLLATQWRVDLWRAPIEKYGDQTVNDD
jgi:hypothetical protein